MTLQKASGTAFTRDKRDWVCPTREHGKGGEEIPGPVLLTCKWFMQMTSFHSQRPLRQAPLLPALQRETWRPRDRVTHPAPRDRQNLTPGSWVPETSLTRSLHCSTLRWKLIGICWRPSSQLQAPRACPPEWHSNSLTSKSMCQINSQREGWKF